MTSRPGAIRMLGTGGSAPRGAAASSAVCFLRAGAGRAGGARTPAAAAPPPTSSERRLLLAALSLPLPLVLAPREAACRLPACMDAGQSFRSKQTRGAPPRARPPMEYTTERVVALALNGCSWATGCSAPVTSVDAADVAAAPPPPAALAPAPSGLRHHC